MIKMNSKKKMFYSLEKITAFLTLTLGLCLPYSAQAVQISADMSQDYPDTYAADVVARVAQVYQQPSNAQGTAKMLIRIAKDGRPYSCELQVSSGQTSVDEAICVAVAQVGRFSPPPFDANSAAVALNFIYETPIPPLVMTEALIPVVNDGLAVETVTAPANPPQTPLTTVPVTPAPVVTQNTVPAVSPAPVVTQAPVTPAPVVAQNTMPVPSTTIDPTLNSIDPIPNPTYVQTQPVPPMVNPTVAPVSSIVPSTTTTPAVTPSPTPAPTTSVMPSTNLSSAPSAFAPQTAQGTILPAVPSTAPQVGQVANPQTSVLPVVPVNNAGIQPQNTITPSASEVKQEVEESTSILDKIKTQPQQRRTVRVIDSTGREFGGKSGNPLTPNEPEFPQSTSSTTSTTTSTAQTTSQGTVAQANLAPVAPTATPQQSTSERDVHYASQAVELNYAQQVLKNVTGKIVLPESVKAGTYLVQVRLIVSGKGALQHFSIIQPSTDVNVDNAVITAMMQPNVIIVPENGREQEVVLTFNLEK